MGIPRVGISRFHCTPNFDSFIYKHVSYKNLNYYTFGAALYYLWRRTLKYVALEVTSDVLKRSFKENDILKFDVSAI